MNRREFIKTCLVGGLLLLGDGPTANGRGPTRISLRDKRESERLEVMQAIWGKATKKQKLITAYKSGDGFEGWQYGLHIPTKYKAAYTIVTEVRTHYNVNMGNEFNHVFIVREDDKQGMKREIDYSSEPYDDPILTAEQRERQERSNILVADQIVGKWTPNL